VRPALGATLCIALCRPCGSATLLPHMHPATISRLVDEHRLHVAAADVEAAAR